MASAVREAVFMGEQGVPAELEWDGRDAVALHALAEDASGSSIGTARLLKDGHIGRMAVMSHWRGRGVGSAMLDRLVESVPSSCMHKPGRSPSTSGTGSSRREPNFWTRAFRTF
jgi:predicted GNAT family N-acyltransferase